MKELSCKFKCAYILAASFEKLHRKLFPLGTLVLCLPLIHAWAWLKGPFFQRYPSLYSFNWVGANSGEVAAVLVQHPALEQIIFLLPGLASLILCDLCYVQHPVWFPQSKLGPSSVLHHAEFQNKSRSANCIRNICKKMTHWFVFKSIDSTFTFGQHELIFFWCSNHLWGH